MAPLKKVNKLCDLCQKNVKDRLQNVLIKIRENATTSKEENCQILSEYFTHNLPQSSSADILDAILQDSEIDTEIKYLAVLVLQGPNSRRLKFALGFPSEYHEQILNHLEYSSSELENADFRGLWLQDPSIVETFNRNVLSKMSRLRQLAIPHIATDRMLEVISDNCRQLISLDLYGSSGVTARGFKILSRRLGSKLQILNLGGPIVVPLEPEIIAESIPDLKEIASFGSYPFAGAAVALLADKNLKTKLKYIHDRYTTAETMMALPDICPNLQAIFLDSPEKGILKHLQKFPRLGRLKVSKLDCDDFHTTLESFQPEQPLRLSVLEIVNARGSLDLFRVSNSFPKLEVFEIYHSTSIHVSFKDNFKLPNLKKLIIYDTELSGAASEPILSGCPQIVTLTLAHCEELSDEIFMQILEKNPMTKCEELSLLFAPLLSADTLRYIISCLENIRYVGRLDSWNVGWTEVEELRFEIQHFNLDVTLGEQFNNIDKFQAVENQENEFLGFGLFPELDRVFPSVPLWIDFYHVKNSCQRLTAVGCEDGELFVWLVDLNSSPAKILLSCESEFEGTVSQVKFFKPYEDDLVPPKGLERSTKFQVDPSEINLLAVSTLSPSVVYENVLQQGLKCSRTLFRSDDYDVTTCAAVTDIDFDGQKEIILGTFGQQLLVYKLIEKFEAVKVMPSKQVDKEEMKIETVEESNVTQHIEAETKIEKIQQKMVLKWELIWTRAFNAPIMALSNLDLTGDGLEEIAIATSRGLQILQHDVDKVEALLRSRFQTNFGEKS